MLIEIELNDNFGLSKKVMYFCGLLFFTNVQFRERRVKLIFHRSLYYKSLSRFSSGKLGVSISYCDKFPVVGLPLWRSLFQEKTSDGWRQSREETTGEFYWRQMVYRWQQSTVVLLDETWTFHMHIGLRSTDQLTVSLIAGGYTIPCKTEGWRWFIV